MYSFYVRSFFLIILYVFSLSTFANECGEAFDFKHSGFISSVMDVKTRAKASLGRNLKEEEVRAIYTANDVYVFKSIMKNMPIDFSLRRENEAIELGNYILQEAGFKEHEIQALRKVHVVGLNYDIGDSLLFHRHFISGNVTGQNSWFIYENSGRNVVGRIIKKIDENSLLVEIIDHNSGRIRKRKIIFEDILII